jgi:hypothetical protein
MLTPNETPERTGLWNLVVGVAAPHDEITSARTIRVGTDSSYGWRLTVAGLNQPHRVTEEFTLPEPSDWEGAIVPPWVSPDGSIQIIRAAISPDRRTMTTHMIVDFARTDHITQRYGISPADPKGEYQFRLYLDERLLSERHLTIE